MTSGPPNGDSPHRYVLCNNGEEELYDYRTDPRECKNLAAEAAYAEQKAQLRDELVAITGCR